MAEFRICKKCLLKDMPEAEYFQNLYDYISHLDPDIRASKEEYERRLTVCQSCDNLLSGMCRICGCYVELRAAIEVQCCPDAQERWSHGSTKAEL